MGLDLLTLDEALRQAKGLRGSRVRDLTTPFVMAHRGGGLNIAPDNSLNAMQFAAARAGGGNVLIDGGDVDRLKDGAFVCMHDTTINRTTTGTGNVSAQSSQSWMGLVIDPTDSGQTPPMPGWPTEHPPFAGQVLDQIAARVPVQLELKTPSATDMAALVALVKQRKVTDQVMVAQYVRTAGEATAFAPAGGDGSIVSCAILDAPTSRTAAQIIATGAKYAQYDVSGFASSVSGADAYLAALVAAGIKVAPFVVDRRTQWAIEQARGATWCISNDPFYLIQAASQRTTDLLGAGAWTDGLIPGITFSGSGMGRPHLSAGWLMFGVNGDDPALPAQTSTSGHWCCIGGMAQATLSQLDFTVRNDQGSDTSRWCGAIICRGDDTNAYVGSNNTAAVTGYFVGIRASGGFFVSKLNGDGTSTSLGTATGSAIGVSGTSAISIVVSPTQIVVKQAGSTVLTITDNTYRGGGYFHLGQTTPTNSGGSQEKFSFSAITVTP